MIHNNNNNYFFICQKKNNSKTPSNEILAAKIPTLNRPVRIR